MLLCERRAHCDSTHECCLRWVYYIALRSTFNLLIFRKLDLDSTILRPYVCQLISGITRRTSHINVEELGPRFVHRLPSCLLHQNISNFIARLRLLYMAYETGRVILGPFKAHTANTAPVRCLGFYDYRGTILALPKSAFRVPHF